MFFACTGGVHGSVARTTRVRIFMPDRAGYRGFSRPVLALLRNVININI
jgi:hypothetical protein